MNSVKKLPLVVQWALFLFSRGFKLFPIHGIDDSGSCTCRKASCTSPGKHPMVKNWTTSGHFESREEICQFWQKHPDANYGILTTGLVVIDVDERSGGKDSYQKMILPHLNEPELFIVRTGSGGFSRHVFFSDPLLEFKNASGIFPGVDIRAQGGYVVGAGAKHKSGFIYEPLSYGGLDVGNNLSQMPGALKQILNNRKAVEKGNARANVIFGGAVTEGSRNETLASYGGELRRKGLAVGEIYELLLKKNETFNPPLNTQEVFQVAQSMGRYAPNGFIDWPKPNLDYSVKEASHQDIGSELVPPFFQEFVEKTHKSVGVPKSAIMVSVLTAISSVLGVAYKVKPIFSSGYQVPLNLWGAIIAPPGGRKTSIVNLLKNVLSEVDQYFEEERKKKQLSIREERVKLKQRINDAKKDQEERRNAESNLEKLKAEEAPWWCLIANDTTPEALALLFKDNFRGIFLHKDELDGLLSVLSKRGFENLRSLLNESWNGGQPYRTTRVSRGIIDVKSATISILGGIQPDVLNDSFRSEIRKGLAGDGFFARFQLFSNYGTKDLKDIDYFSSNSDSRENVFRLVRALHESTKEFNIYGEPKNEPLVLSHNGFEKYVGFERGLSKLIQTSENQAFLSHISKLSRLVLSLSGIFHVVDTIVGEKNINSEISEDHVVLAVKWAEYMLKQAHEIYFSSTKNSSAKRFVSKVLEGEIVDGMSVRAIYKKGWSCLERSEDVLSAIEAIEESHWVKVETSTPKGGGRPTDIVRLNPLLTEWLKTQEKGIKGKHPKLTVEV